MISLLVQPTNRNFIEHQRRLGKML